MESPYRDRTVEENLDLFARMRAGEFKDGSHVLRAKIDMTSPNMLMRDPVLYRIRHAHHYRQGDSWCIYPLYDYAHCLEDAFEGVTHSLCTLEFENNRELYDWVLDHVGFEEPRPRQYEFARLELEHAVLSKRRIAPLVSAGVVSGWDDPRLSTVAGIRRRGVPPEAVRLFADMIGVATHELDRRCGQVQLCDPGGAQLRGAPRHGGTRSRARGAHELRGGARRATRGALLPERHRPGGSRLVPLTRELFIERDDFDEDPPAGFRRLVPGERCACGTRVWSGATRS